MSDIPGFIETKYGPSYLQARKDWDDGVEMGDWQPAWSDYLFKPVIEELRKRMPNTKIEGYGPFGLRCICDIVFMRGDAAYSISLDTGDLSQGEMRIVDYSNKVDYFAHGTIAWLNSMNYGFIPLPPTMDEFIEMVELHLGETK